VNYWLLKTEPGTYSYADLAREKTARWDGVSAPAALRHIRDMKPGDQVMIYHTGDEKSVVGLARVASEPYADPKLDDPARVVVDLTADRPLMTPVSLAEIKADPRFKDMPLVRIGRLSVMPVTPVQWKALLDLGGGIPKKTR
jgi:predicted RNA-binding protein with PUA-like domain